MCAVMSLCQTALCCFWFKVPLFGMVLVWSAAVSNSAQLLMTLYAQRHMCTEVKWSQSLQTLEQVETHYRIIIWHFKEIQKKSAFPLFTRLRYSSLQSESICRTPWTMSLLAYVCSLNIIILDKTFVLLCLKINLFIFIQKCWICL